MQALTIIARLTSHRNKLRGENNLSRFFYDADAAKPFLSVRLNSHLMGRIDEARLRLKVSRSHLVRRAINDMLDKMQIAEAA
ncbi:ribbon-helix-helix protein, CopG family [Nitrobacter winogradskyi]|uniref:ribbon-helix-helix protein, CopG family n=1 Tax=Nitrobacter winogradskyi TaxID=913 RepID=UPI001142C7EF